MGSADFLEALVYDFVREFGTVAVAAEVTEKNVAQFGGHDLFGDLRCGVVREMAVATEDSLLQTPRPFRVFLQHFQVVIRLEHEGARGADAFEHELRGVAKIGQETHVSRRCMQEKTDGIIRVVRHAEGVHGKIADLEGSAGGEEAEIQAGRALGLDGLLREAVAKNRNRLPRAESGEARDVVAVLVRDEDAGEGFGRAIDRREALANLAAAEPGIDENAGVVGFEVGAVARGTTAEDREMDWHGSDARGRLREGQRISDFRRRAGFSGALRVCGARVSRGLRDAAIRGKPRWQRMKRVLSARVRVEFRNFSLLETALLLVLSGGDF